MNCIRCSKAIPHPNPSNSDYIIASDTTAREPREVLVALKHNLATSVKRAKIIADKTVTLDTGTKAPPTEDFIRNQFQDDEYDAVEVQSVIAAQEQFGDDLVKIVAKEIEKDIQKTGIICPGCYKPTDTVIWGVHKAK